MLLANTCILYSLLVENLYNLVCLVQLLFFLACFVMLEWPVVHMVGRAAARHWRRCAVRLPAGQLDCTLCGVIGGVLPGILRVLSGGVVAAFHVFGGLLRHFAAECLAVSGYWAARGLQ